MGEIEPLLGMMKATMCRELDLEYDCLKILKKSASITSEAYKKRAEQFQKQAKYFKHFRGSGFDGLIYIAKVLIVVWFLSTLTLWAAFIVSFIPSA